MQSRLPRLPLLAIGLASLLAGGYAGLVRMGWPWPSPGAAYLAGHGPLLVAGFAGTVIALERAIVLQRAWAYAAPVLSACGAVVMLAGGPLEPAAALQAGAALLLAAVFAAHLRRRPSFAIASLLVGAIAWTVGSVALAAGASLANVVPSWIAFVAITIVGERLDLNHLLRGPGGRRMAVGAFAIVVAGAALGLVRSVDGLRVIGAGLLALAAFGWRGDVSGAAVRRSGLTRFVGTTIRTAYVWLAISGALMLTFDPSATYRYDALLHAVFVGFVLSMVFAHAPIIFPAILDHAVPYRSAFWLHVALLHASLVLRIGADLAGWEAGRAWGGLLNGVAVLAFLANTALALRARAPRLSR